MRRSGSGRTTARITEAAILLVLPVLSHFLFPVRILVVRPWSYLGVPLMVIGVGLAMWAAKAFREAGTGFRLQGGSSVLTTGGPFRISRNPMYLAMLMWLLGLAVLLGSLTAFVFPLLLFVLANFLIIPPEERKLEEVFGEPYAAYRARVRRWF
jgi:protein-S-isoprenylcysteine O-methyltransferase Ste14